jgi:hypothetical protein
MLINGRQHTILGIMPSGFRYPYGAEAWVPLGLGPSSEEWTRGNLNISARLATGSSLEAAREEMEIIAARLRVERPGTNAGVGISMVPIKEEILEGMDAKVRALLGASVFVLLIAGVNVATLVLTRIQRTKHELSVKMALGARAIDISRPILA